MTDPQTFQTLPSAYYFMDESAPLWYRALLNVARQSLGVRLKEIKKGQQPGSNSHIVIPPGINAPATPYILEDEQEVIRDAIVARTLLPVPNIFLYYKISEANRFEINRSLGLMIVGNIGAFFTACCQIPTPLGAYEIQRILESSLVSEAKFLLHKLKGSTKSQKDAQPLIDAVKSCISNAIKLGLLSEDYISLSMESGISDELEAALRRAVEEKR
jgi:hypothetical protein